MSQYGSGGLIESTNWKPNLDETIQVIIRSL